VLVLHHEKMPARCVAPTKCQRFCAGSKREREKLVMVQGGENPTGDPCEAFHWHGFIGMEQEAVDIITDWIARPVE